MASDSSSVHSTPEEYCELVNREDSQIRIKLIDKQRTIVNAGGFVSEEKSNNEVLNHDKYLHNHSRYYYLGRAMP